MDKEIKERIAAINSGIIPEGYKKTKVGIVPVEWEVEHIGEHLQEYRELSNDIEKYPVYSSSRKGLIPQSDYYDQKEATQTNLGYKIVPVGYVTYRHMSDDDIFHFNLNTTGKSVLVSSEYPVFNAKSNANLYYIISCLNEMPRFRYFCRSQKLGGTRTRLYYKNLSMYQLSFPPLPEQQKIAEILSTQDKLIELQEKKIEQLKELKKAYLQKMFPKKGSKYPELRFKGFTDPWEQRKLGDMCDEFQSGKSIKASEITDSGRYAVYGGNGFRGYTNTYNHDGDFALIGRQGALCGNMNFSSGKAYFTEHAVAVHGNNDNDTLFLYYLLDLMNLGQYSGQSAQPGLAVNKIIQLTTKVPNIAEQKQISCFFKALDNLITLHQRKSEQEKQKKKALMQLLLTGIVRTK
ncbi:restriction endonuclease subunit S [Ruminococcus flavefaciens]|uniref:Restriction endonuclease S subunit n=1 Tax=Ruminococcus flavefaciens TaxID=1265 RepID=A0A315YGF0_RUMFL|nr:restriction endonuclease subunit S [Ruminococcus flavefaciens]PWJ10085.1 restriction endonuclease S subunit [Ruminococcus flavefaciens]SSA52039.1 Type I restriction modification DNA specificity domain-containing protein [Ruminococcus flavefaciens]